MTKINKPKQNKRLFMGAFFVLVGFVLFGQQIQEEQSNLKQLFENKQSGVMVEFDGQVKRILSDDKQGSRHQRFIVQTNGLTVLIAHNIDLAKRVPLGQGDILTVFGQYEWNEQGGVVHWTHADPQGHHVGGWIKFDGKTYGSLIIN